MDTVELNSFNPNMMKTDTSTVSIPQIVAIETLNNQQDKCRLHLAGGSDLVVLHSHQALLEKIGGRASSITVDVWDVLGRNLPWAMFVEHITAITGKDNQQDESHVALSNGEEYKVLMGYQDLVSRFKNDGAYSPVR
ncbi:hypothetical protein C9993_01870 [Marinobacter sp. Z-F4-2]|nr:hypothetical protein C9993_01870 [Marinobacter sp. Z-F4-2]